MSNAMKKGQSRERFTLINFRIGAKMFCRRRKYSRTPIILLCDIFIFPSERPQGRGCIVNFSLGGIALETTLDITPETNMLLRLNLFSENIDIFGRAVYKKQEMENAFIYGVKFIGMNIFRRFKFKNKLKEWHKLGQTEKKIEFREQPN